VVLNARQIVQLQEEMEREDKTLDDLRNRENAAADVKQKTKLRDEMVFVHVLSEIFLST
jgi:hypothetical protein